MSRAFLLRSLSIAALATAAAHNAQASTLTTIYGGGATSPEYDYIAEQASFNSLETGIYAFSTYYPLSSSSAQKAFIANTASSFGTGLTFDVEYVASDNALTSTLTASWASTTAGQTTSGPLIQVPALGTGPAVVVVNSKITASGNYTGTKGPAGSLALTDTQLCGIFSGKLTDWSQVASSKIVAPGTITVVYRSDTAATTQFLTNHWFATVGGTTVCNATNSNFATYAPTNSFAALFPLVSGKTVFPANFIGEAQNIGVATELAASTSAVGYVAPDYTSLNPNSNAFSSNPTLPKTLQVAAIYNGTKNAYVPTVTNIELGLAHPGAGATNLTPPTANGTGTGQAGNPLSWVPVVPVVTSGYPYVGYGTLDFAQCYANPLVAKGIIAFMGKHYGATFKSIQLANGLAPLGNTKIASFLTAVSNSFLTNKSGWGLDIGDKTVCKGFTGR